MRNIRGIVDDFRTTMEEDQALLAVAAALAGIGAAFLVDLYGPEAETSTLTITITQARATLLSALALVFTGLSIVLALVALTTGNMANKFSPRFLRMKLRHSSSKWVLSAFVLTASFIITSQILLRNREGDDLAPPGMLFSSTGLVAITGVVIIVYIDQREPRRPTPRQLVLPGIETPPAYRQTDMACLGSARVRVVRMRRRRRCRWGRGVVGEGLKAVPLRPLVVEITTFPRSEATSGRVARTDQIALLQSFCLLREVATNHRVTCQLDGCPSQMGRIQRFGLPPTHQPAVMTARH